MKKIKKKGNETLILFLSIELVECLIISSTKLFFNLVHRATLNVKSNSGLLKLRLTVLRSVTDPKTLHPFLDNQIQN